VLLAGLLAYAVSLWLGLYLLARSPQKAPVRHAGAGLLVTGWLPFSPEGWWLMVIQALVVAGFTEAQYIGLRRLSRT